MVTAGIISVVIGGRFGGGDHFDGGDHFGGGTHGLRFVDFDPLCVFLCFKVRCF